MARKVLSVDERVQVAEMFHSDMTCVEVGAFFGCSHTTVQKVWKETYGAEAMHQRQVNFMRQRRGAKHHAWKGGVSQLASGYRLIPAPDWYEGYTDERRRAPEHIIKYCEYNNLTRVPDGFHIHHRDEDKTNNSENNLVAISNSEHSATHAMRRTRDYYGRFV